MYRKYLMAMAVLVIAITMNAQSPISLGLRIGKGPSVNPGTNHLMVNRQGPLNTGIVNAEHVRYSEQLGLLLRYDKNRFWFMTELTYGRSNTEYSLQYLNNVQEGASLMILHEKRSFLEMPLVAGVSLGVIEVFSGVSLTYDLRRQNAFAGIEGFSSSGRQVHPGWLGGVGVNLGKVLLDIRYLQQFSNYGQGYFAGDQELLLKNSPGRFMITGGFRF